MKIVNHLLCDAAGAPVPFVPSPNVGGALKPKYLVMHYTAGRSAKRSVAWLTSPTAKASAHLVIGRDGSITQLVPFDVVAWHAGASEWLGMKGLNHHSIGIELDNAGVLSRSGAGWRTYFGVDVPASDVVEAAHKHGGPVKGWHAYTEVQIEVAFEVAAALVGHYGLVDVLGHEDIAPGRKTDPGPAFPLESLRAQLVGRKDDAAETFVTTAKANVRSGPGTEFAQVIAKPLPAGTKVEVVRVEAPWFLVDVLDPVAGVADVQGFVHGRLLARAADAPTRKRSAVPA